MMTPPQPYAETKDSGVPWLSVVPAHWEAVPLRQIGRFFKGSGGTKEDEVPKGIPCIRYGDLYAKYGAFITEAASFIAPERAMDYTPVRIGDVLLAGSGETLDEIGKSAVNLIEGDVRCGGDVLIFRPNCEINRRFLGYALDGPSSNHQKACMGRGITVMHIYADELKYLHIALPPLSEQDAIAAFLDDAGRRIGRAIRAKQKLIALLNEQKQAVIYRAVTRGLDANVRLKPSGVDWLGEVPEHWETRRVQALFRERVESGRGDLPILMVSIAAGVGVADQSNHDARPRKLIDDRSQYKLAIKGDIAYNTMRMWQGAVGIVPEDGLVSPAYVVCAPRAGTNAAYYASLFRTHSCRHAIVARSRGIADDRNRLYWDAFKPLLAPVPPIHEQTAIVAALDQAARRHTTLLDAARREIDLLRQYRTRLIADVVTGKLDVREAAARLPDELDEPEPPDDGDVEGPADEAVEDLKPVEA
jgi:type I restriction enzyme, S subunit